MKLTRLDEKYPDSNVYSTRKTPRETGRTTIDCTQWITQDDAVASCSLSNNVPGLSVTIANGNTTKPVVVIGGGTDGNRYQLNFLITTNDGLKIEITIFVVVKETQWGYQS